jgi:hypothetical protein
MAPQCGSETATQIAHEFTGTDPQTIDHLTTIGNWHSGCVRLARLAVLVVAAAAPV